MSAKREEPHPQDLSALEESYEIIGELNARDHVREYLARHRGDGSDVLVLVEDTPEGDAGNALTLYAADANLLATLAYRNLIPIREGRWIGNDAFAVVTERCSAPTLRTLLGRGQKWSYPRIATILHEVNGLLEWARGQKVVHRTLTLDTLHLERDTDRVLASFIAAPLTRHGPPGPEGDARTIAALAWSLITDGRELPASPEDSIGVVRPELPRRVAEATDALLHGKRAGETDPPSPADYIGLVAMTDVIATGEVEAAELQAVLHQEQVLEREAWAETERGYQEQLAEQERRIAEERETMARTLEEERAEMARTIEEERQALADQRAELEAAVAAEREALIAERAQHERELASEREQLATDRERHEQELADERAQLARTLEEERAAMAGTIAEERARLEGILADEREKLDAERTESEAALAAARTEFEEERAAQRAELDRRLAEEREEFDRLILDERNAMEAEKEGLAVFHAAERDAIAAERRALEELYLAYEADGQLLDTGEREAPERDTPERGAVRRRTMLADMAPVAVAQPITERDADPHGPADTESGLTRDDAVRSRRAAWGVPAAIIGLVAILGAMALGIGMTRGSDDGDGDVVEPAVSADAPAADAPAAVAPAAVARPRELVTPAGTPDSDPSAAASPDSQGARTAQPQGAPMSEQRLDTADSRSRPGDVSTTTVARRDSASRRNDSTGVTTQARDTTPAPAPLATPSQRLPTPSALPRAPATIRGDTIRPAAPVTLPVPSPAIPVDTSTAR